MVRKPASLTRQFGEDRLRDVPGQLAKGSRMHEIEVTMNEISERRLVPMLRVTTQEDCVALGGGRSRGLTLSGVGLMAVERHGIQ